MRCFPVDGCGIARGKLAIDAYALVGPSSPNSPEIDSAIEEVAVPVIIWAILTCGKKDPIELFFLINPVGNRDFPD